MTMLFQTGKEGPIYKSNSRADQFQFMLQNSQCQKNVGKLVSYPNILYLIESYLIITYLILSYIIVSQRNASYFMFFYLIESYLS